MLRRINVKSLPPLCTRYRDVSTPRKLFDDGLHLRQGRSFHLNLSPRVGFWSLYLGDKFETRAQKEIEKMLEDYDKKLLKVYTNTAESVPLFR
jgi:hypothetical protein